MFLAQKWNNLPSAVSGFTLIELVVAITILFVIMVSVFEAYSNIIGINKRLELLRLLQENARSVTETIANDVREKGIDFAYYDGSEATKKTNYTASGTTILAIHGGTKYYPMKNSLSGPILCDENDIKDPNVLCFLWMENTSGKRIALMKDSVKIDRIRFFISGDMKTTTTNQDTEWKVLVNFTIESNQKAGTNLNNVALDIQTTISEKIYKKD